MLQAGQPVPSRNRLGTVELRLPPESKGAFIPIWKPHQYTASGMSPVYGVTTRKGQQEKTMLAKRQTYDCINKIGANY